MSPSRNPLPSVDLPPKVVAYIEAVPAPQRGLFDQLHTLVLETLPDVKVVYSYNMPAYVAAGGRVSLSSGPHGVSISTRVPEPIATFHAKHKNFNVGKVSVLFKQDDEIPMADVAELIRTATE